MNKEKKKFEESRMEIYQFSFTDVITTSTRSGGVNGFDVEDSSIDFSSGIDNYKD